jgi:hypothetical protein
VSKSVHDLVTKAINGLVDKLALIAFAASLMAVTGQYIDKPRIHIVSLPVFCWKMDLENEYQLLNPEFKQGPGNSTVYPNRIANVAGLLPSEIIALVHPIGRLIRPSTVPATAPMRSFQSLRVCHTTSYNLGIMTSPRSTFFLPVQICTVE